MSFQLPGLRVCRQSDGIGQIDLLRYVIVDYSLPQQIAHLRQREDYRTFRIKFGCLDRDGILLFKMNAASQQRAVMAHQPATPDSLLNGIRHPLV